MKRYISTAFLVLSFVLALVNAGHTALDRTATVTGIEHAGGYAVHYLSHPNTELELYHSTGSIAHNGIGRSSISGGFISHNEYAIVNPVEWPNHHRDQPTGLYSKEYLSHIYPYHNFW